jgi:hypothetical protein
VKQGVPEGMDEGRGTVDVTDGIGDVDEDAGEENG